VGGIRFFFPMFSNSYWLQEPHSGTRVLQLYDETYAWEIGPPPLLLVMVIKNACLVIP
jgi:hypothetical protein